MPAQVVCPERVELSIFRPDNFLLIENHAEGVVIRVARDNFSAQGKSFLIRYLAVEGYIPERYQWFVDTNAASNSGLQWIIDPGLTKSREEGQRKALRQILHLILWAGVVWLALMSFAFRQALH
jgi:hypothetical protein